MSRNDEYTPPHSHLLGKWNVEGLRCQGQLHWDRKGYFPDITSVERGWTGKVDTGFREESRVGCIRTLVDLQDGKTVVDS